MKKLLLIAALLAPMPTMAGGLVVIEEEYDVTEPAPRNDWVIPVIIGGLVLCAIACGGGDEDSPSEPPKEPGPICYTDC